MSVSVLPWDSESVLLAEEGVGANETEAEAGGGVEFMASSPYVEANEPGAGAGAGVELVIIDPAVE